MPKSGESPRNIPKSDLMSDQIVQVGERSNRQSDEHLGAQPKEESDE